MVTKSYNKINFHNHTFCIWTEVPFAEIEGVKINYKSKSGSQYIFTKLGLYRISNHWGRVADCHWRLVPLEQFKNQNNTVAFAHWADFYSNDETSKLFFVKVNYDTKTVNFYHKETSEYDGKAILRTANQTAKTIKIIRQIFNEIAWAKYIDYDDLNLLRKEIVHELVTTENSFITIKRKFQLL